MRIMKLFLLFIFFACSIKGLAQNFELGKVTIAELQEKRHPKDSTANAAILFKTGSVYFEGLTTITRVKTKIKIYKKEGFGIPACALAYQKYDLLQPWDTVSV